MKNIGRWKLLNRESLGSLTAPASTKLFWGIRIVLSAISRFLANNVHFSEIFVYFHIKTANMGLFDKA